LATQGKEAIFFHMNGVAKMIGRGTAWASVGALGVKVAGLLATFVTLHQLTVYEYGLTELAISIIPLLSIFVLPGITTVVQAEMSLAKAKKDGPKERALFEQYFLVQLALSIIPWALVFFGAELIARWYNEGIADLFRIVSFSFLISPFRAVMTLLFRVNLRFKTIASYGVCEELLKFFLLMTCYFVFDLRAMSVIIAYVLNELLAILIFMRPFLKEYIPLRHNSKVVGQYPFYVLMSTHGKWGIATNYLNNFANNIRLWIIKAFLGADAVGLFALASSLFSHTLSLLQLNSVITPILPQYAHEPVRFNRLVEKSIKYQLIGYTLSGVVTSIAFPILITYLFPKFLPALPLFFIIVFTVIPAALSGVLTAVFTALQAQRELFFATLIKTFFIVLLAPPLIKIFGVYGIAIEFFLTTLLFTMERYRVLRKRLQSFDINLRDMFAVDQDDRIIIGALRSYAQKYIKIGS
jgi:O-antigen/teichoic acid export membrane protein